MPAPRKENHVEKWPDYILHLENLLIVYPYLKYQKYGHFRDLQGDEVSQRTFAVMKKEGDYVPTNIG